MRTIFLVMGLCLFNTHANENLGDQFIAHYADLPISIDGSAKESGWQHAPWYPIDKIILGSSLKATDFNGRFQLLWNEKYIYIHAEIQDDVLVDKYPSPTDRYWDDDCLEIFVDEDASGGDHLYNFNAFAYHVALDNQVADIGIDPQTNAPAAMLFNDHITSHWKRQSTLPHKISWELAVRVFDDSFDLNKPAESVQLKANKQLGFMLAYCDNDGSDQREHFIGSTAINAINGDKNLGYKTADVFGQLILMTKGK